MFELWQKKLGISGSLDCEIKKWVFIIIGAMNGVYVHTMEILQLQLKQHFEFLEL